MNMRRTCKRKECGVEFEYDENIEDYYYCSNECYEKDNNITY